MSRPVLPPQPEASSSTAHLAPAASVSAPAAQKHSDSMLRRLAGQSVNKAGLKRDPAEVARIISEASANSPFYDNERRKDEALGRKIEALLARRDALLKTADWERLGRVTDDIIKHIEATRDGTRTIVHVDLDAFYANVELLTDSSLAGIAFGVGEGVLTTASYEARAFGARSGMPGFIAKKLCPHIRFVKPHFDEYNKWSHKVMAVFRPYAMGKMSIAGVDEAYLDITQYMADHAMSAEDVVQKLRAECKEKTGLTVSAGIAPTKMLAKICSDRNKPNGQFTCPSDRAGLIDFTRPLAIRLVPGIGRATERSLQALGIETCGDIVSKRRELYLLDYGVTELLKASLGCTSNVCKPGQKSDRKTVGVERTFKAMSKPERLVQELEDIAGELEEHLEALRFVGRTVVFKFKTNEFESHTRDKTLTYEVSKKAQIIAVARKLLDTEMMLDNKFSIRLMGLRVAKLRDLDAVPTGKIDSYFKKSPAKQTQPFSKASSSKSTLRGGSAEEAISLDDDSDSDGMKQFDDGSDDEVDLEDRGSAGIDWEFPPAAREVQAKGKGKGKESSQSSQSPKKRKLTPPVVKARSASVEEGEDEEEMLAVVCPSCSHVFPLKSSNLTINTHLDSCLSDVDADVAIYISSDEEEQGRSSRAKRKKKVKVEREDSGKKGKVAASKGKKAAKPKSIGKGGKGTGVVNTFEAMMKAR